MKGRARQPEEIRTGAPASVEVLRGVAYFRSLPPMELRDLARRCAIRTLRRGELVFTEGEPCHGLVVIAEGGVEVRRVSGRGREQVLHTEGPGATLGEVPLFDGGGYVASAAAVVPTRLLFLPRAALLELCRRRPAVALALLASLARRVRRFAELAGDLAFREVTERVARHLEAAAASRGGAIAPGTEFELALTQEQLAARLGTVRELVARSLAQLRRRGVIAQRRRRITILDPGRLIALSRGQTRLERRP
ncbi:MAG: Crp/Fnr family transcriptional regulator [Candidatus Rokubacteria bacterium]|nr:Crp/Fnr family transcriptional regulator [Candidatus Rokubacteria bacterium]